jgi:hypothetical protein
MEENKIEIPTG